MGFRSTGKDPGGANGTPASPGPLERRKRRIKTMTAATVAGVMGLGMAGGTALSASAAVTPDLPYAEGVIIHDFYTSGTFRDNWAGSWEQAPGIDGSADTGRAFCIEAGPAPTTNPGPAEILDNAQMAYVLAAHEDDGADANAAIAYLSHREIDPGAHDTNGLNERQRWLDTFTAEYPNLVNQANGYWAEAAANAGPYTTSPVITLSPDGRTGQVQGVGVTSGSGAPIAGFPFTVTLDGPAVFDQNGGKTLTGNSAASLATFPITSTGSGKVSVTVDVEVPASHVITYKAAGDEQRMIVQAAPENISGESDPVVVTFDFQPVGTSAVKTKVVDKGHPLVDTLEVDAAAGDTWVVDPTTGEYVEVTFEGTAYATGNSPVATPGAVPADAVVVGTATIVATGPGSYEAQSAEASTDSGFVTWVWKVVKANQPTENQKFIRGDWADQYGLADETSSVRHSVDIDTQISPRVTKDTTYLVDDVFVDGFPSDHPEFKGAAGFGPDTTEMTQRLLHFPAGAEVSDANAAAATVVAESTLPARNGFYPTVGGMKFRVLTDENGQAIEGTYVFVTEFAGDDRVSPVITSVEDVTEQYVVAPEPVVVTTKATGGVKLGEPAHDVATVTGTVPAGATLTFEAYLQDGETPVCTDPVFTTEFGEVDGPGEYTSEEVVFTEAGTYYWVETLYNDQGQVLHRGECGVPDETTVVESPTVTTKATGSIKLGEPAHDVATVSGGVPAGATLTFEAYLQDGETPVCTDPVFTTEFGEVDGPGEYTSEEVVFTEAGTYYWVETLRDADGQVIHRGECGLPDETTVVESVPVVVTTKATGDVKLGEPAHDVATVTGSVPAGATLTFEAYLQDGETAICTDPVFTTEFGEVDGPGEYTSEEVVFTEAGTYYWVETLYNDQGQVLHRGECGVPDETTVVEGPTVTTKAASDNSDKPVVGDSIWDTVQVEGPFPAGSTVTVDLYYAADGEELVCSEPIWTSEPIAIVEGTTEYATNQFATKVAGTYGFVERTVDAEGNVISEGECGESAETITVSNPVIPEILEVLEVPQAGQGNAGSGGVLASTGASVLAAGLGALALIAGGAALVVRRRRMSTGDIEG